jgi:acetoacetate decarboxylase
LGTPGLLTKAQIGYSVPVDAPLYYPLPIKYRDVSMLLFDYLTDRTAAAGLLPAPLELPDIPGQPNLAAVKMLFAEYPWTSLGPYNETAQVLPCQYKGQPFLYAVRLHVTADTAMAAGREIGGFPKKLGHIDFVNQESYLCSLERPRGLRICTGTLYPVSQLLTIPLPANQAITLPAPFNMTMPLPPPGPQPMPVVLPFASLRVFPSPVSNAPPAIAQLVQTTWLLTRGEIWSGFGSCQLTGASSLDPYHKLPVLAAVDCLLYRGDMEIAANASVLTDL